MIFVVYYHSCWWLLRYDVPDPKCYFLDRFGLFEIFTQKGFSRTNIIFTICCYFIHYSHGTGRKSYRQQSKTVRTCWHEGGWSVIQLRFHITTFRVTNSNQSGWKYIFTSFGTVIVWAGSGSYVLVTVSSQTAIMWSGSRKRVKYPWTTSLFDRSKCNSNIFSSLNTLPESSKDTMSRCFWVPIKFVFCNLKT